MSDIEIVFAALADVPVDDAWLSPRERAVLARLTIAKRARDWRLGRWAAKRAARNVFGIRDIEVIAAADGAPVLYLDGAPAQASLSISHSDGEAMAVVSPVPRPIGCDIERVEPRSAEFVQSYFTASEIDRIMNAHALERAALANVIWSAKESVLKATHDGLRKDTRTVEVSLEESRGWQPFRATMDDKIYEGVWRIADGRVHTIATGAL